MAMVRALPSAPAARSGPGHARLRLCDGVLGRTGPSATWMPECHEIFEMFEMFVEIPEDSSRFHEFTGFEMFEMFEILHSRRGAERQTELESTLINANRIWGDGPAAQKMEKAGRLRKDFSGDRRNQ